MSHKIYKVKLILKIFYYLIFGTKYYKKLLKSKDIFIYQMGKVGSTSLQNGINNSFHLHSLSTLNNPYFLTNYTERLGILDIALEKIKTNKRQNVIKEMFNTNQKEFKIITLVREPISRNVSAFFQPSKVKNEEYTNNYFYMFSPHFTPLLWFDYEIKKHLGIDVYDYPFPHSKGYQIITHNNFKLLILRMEDLQKNEKVIADFIEQKDFKLNFKNSSKTKWYSEIHEIFNKQFKPTEEYIKLLYNSTYMNHFYTPEEIHRFKNHYLNK